MKNSNLPYSNVSEAMKVYAKLGWPVIPLCSYDHSGMSENHCKVCSKPGKTPLIREWPNASVPDEETIEKWARTWPSMNVGLVLGSRSGIVAIDVDGEYGEDLLTEWSAGDLPTTCEFSTPGGGRRLMYAVLQGVEVSEYSKKH